MNEKTWAKILQWEAICETGNHSNGQGPKLLKFIGRPAELSPKARFKHFFLSYPLPFDRHDWTILRHDGTQVRYVIDYYYDESRANHSPDSAIPSLHDRNTVNSILVDVRPAIDSISNIYDRFFQMPYSRYMNKNTTFEPLSLFPTTALKNQVTDSRIVWEQIQASAAQRKNMDANLDQDTTATLPSNPSFSNPVIHETEAAEIARKFALMLRNCQQAQKNMDKCRDEAECAKASLALTMCMGNVLCPLQHQTVTKIIQQDDATSKTWNAQMDAALENLASCVHLKSEQAVLAKRAYPDVFKTS
jgi:cytochrome c heme-lyase